jgi:outer membrane receptor protein involved in Fe transport
MIVKTIVIASACAVGLFSSLPRAALGAETGSLDPTTALEEITVTAQRRTEKLQDVPLSVTAFTQKDLAEIGIVGYEGLARETPGIVLNQQSANFNNFTARGIATNSYGANLQSTVAIYIDELPISRIGNTTTLNPNLFDVERVEFLRGPQGTLFGSGSLSGALRILTKSPDLKELETSALVDFGVTHSDSLRQRYNAMLNVPLISDTLALRIVGFYRHDEGYLDNVGTGITHSNTLEDAGGRVSLLWVPTDRLSVKFLYSREDSYPEDSSLTSPALGRDKRNSNEPDIYAGVLSNYNATINYHFDGAQLVSSSTYSTFNQKFFVDLAPALGGAVPFGLDAYGFQKNYVEEARLVSDTGGRLDWQIGTFLMSERLNVPFYYRSTLDYLAAHGMSGLPDPPNQFYEKQYTSTHSDELAGFGELTFHVNDRIWLTGGLRYGSVGARSWVNGGYNSNYLTNALFGIPGPLTVSAIPQSAGPNATADRLSYKASASYKPYESLTTYATVATGFRTPVVNATAGSASVINPKDIIIPAGASSDNLRSYEIGAKSRWLDGRLSGNVALYWIDWNNIQVQANRVSDSIQFATNIGGARSKGLEFELRALPLDGLTFALNGSFNQSKVTRLNESEAAISGAVLGAGLSSPPFQGSASSRYEFPVTSTMQGFFEVVLEHVGAFPNSFPRIPGQPTVQSKTYGFTDTYNDVNLLLGLKTGRLTISPYVENVADSRAVTYVHPENFIASRYGILWPRTFGVRFGYNL